MQEYQLSLKDKKIVWGKAIDIEQLINNKSVDSIGQGSNTNKEWNLPAGIYRAKEIVIELDKMLEAMLVQLGEPVNSDPTVLLDSLLANLAISGRLSSLPLKSMELEDHAGKEITAQAVRIGEQLVSWAREINAEKQTLAEYGPETLGEMEFRSHCYGHPLTPEATAQVWGPFGGPRIMQIYNEYLHQFVLLRDALLPFANWEEVPFEVKEYKEFKGLRFLEPTREIFLTQLFKKKLTHKSIVQYAQSVVSSELDKVGYGFQYRLGTVLPSGLGESARSAPRYLLRWHPVQTIQVEDEQGLTTAVAFDYEYDDYYSAPRAEAGKGTPADDKALPEYGEVYDEPMIARLLPKAGTGRTTLQFSVKVKGNEFAVDLGQLFRGQRFVYRPQRSGDAGDAFIKREYLHRHFAEEILSHSELVTHLDGVHFIPTGKNELVLWALLGKLYPENVVLLDTGDQEELEAAYVSGKGFGTQFLVM